MSKSKDNFKRDKNGRFTKETRYSHWKNQKFSEEHKERIRQGYNRNKCKLLGTIKICPKCKKEIIYEDRFSFTRHLNFEHNPMKDPKIVKKAKPAEHFKETNKNYKKGIFPVNWYERFKIGKERHDNAINEQINDFTSQGFRVIPIGKNRDIKPDFIAIKDNKVYAVEVELSSKPDYDKYNGIKYFDDIYWILIRGSDSRVKSCAASASRTNCHAKNGSERVAITK